MQLPLDEKSVFIIVLMCFVVMIQSRWKGDAG